MQDLDRPLLSHLKALEVELHQPMSRGDAARLDALLHDDFHEVGRSGLTYTKAEIIASLLTAAQHADVVAADFLLRRLADDVALLTYRDAHVLSDGTLHRHTLRSSIWRRSHDGWKMSFHQGTPIETYGP